MSHYPSNPGFDASADQSRPEIDAFELPRSMRVLRKKAVAKKYGFSESTLDNRLNPNSRYYDETFPKPIELGAGGSRSSAKGWIEYVIDESLERRKEAAYRS